ncbi:hypothetical protein [Cereibacter sphaeroides]|uniref:hypothetical protein n=1 Tax=Cereibacter sphaeroides TaxID=1063 RepID=UPI001F3E47D1|nr:hypothetical protein [Cereibacter sphaeroides]MCE6967008.1 hypothetical protein [Cereibacter sphaeroides]
MLATVGLSVPAMSPIRQATSQTLADDTVDQGFKTLLDLTPIETGAPVAGASTTFVQPSV